MIRKWDILLPPVSFLYYESMNMMSLRALGVVRLSLQNHTCRDPRSQNSEVEPRIPETNQSTKQLTLGLTVDLTNMAHVCGI